MDVLPTVIYLSTSGYHVSVGSEPANNNENEFSDNVRVMTDNIRSAKQTMQSVDYRG